MTFEECWELVDAYEATGVPCMMLENWSFRQDNLALLNMVRKGLFGEIVHVQASHTHDCIDHWFFSPEGHMRWAAATSSSTTAPSTRRTPSARSGRGWTSGAATTSIRR